MRKRRTKENQQQDNHGPRFSTHIRHFLRRQNYHLQHDGDDRDDIDCDDQYNIREEISRGGPTNWTASWIEEIFWYNLEKISLTLSKPTHTPPYFTFSIHHYVHIHTCGDWRPSNHKVQIFVITIFKYRRTSLVCQISVQLSQSHPSWCFHLVMIHLLSFVSNIMELAIQTGVIFQPSYCFKW